MSKEAINSIIIIIIIIIMIITVGAVIINILGFILDSIRLLHIQTAVGRDSMAAGVEYHGGLGEIGIKNAMMNIVSLLC